MRSLRRQIYFAVTLGIFSLVPLLTQCGLSGPPKGTTTALVKTCVLPTDQSGTLTGKWNNVPIPIGFQAGAFSAAEIQAITQAADTWNKFFTAVIGFNVFDYGTATQPRSSQLPDANINNNLCAAGGSLIQGSKFTTPVVIYKLGRWPASFSPDAIAITSFCTYNTTPQRSMYTAVIELNYQNFFSSGQKVPDLQSILTHELGHLLGLGHSCEFTSKAGTPNCNDSGLNPDYISASMYPNFNFDQFNVGQPRQSINGNDQGRVNCLYPVGNVTNTPLGI